MFHRDNIRIAALSSKCTILFLHTFLIVHILVPRSLGIFQCPVIFSVIENCCLTFYFASNNLPDLFQCLSNLSSWLQKDRIPSKGTVLS